MNIVDVSHTRTQLNGSILVSFVFKMDHMLFGESGDDYELLKVEIRKFLEDLKSRVALIKLESYRAASVNIDKAILTLFCESGLKHDEYFILSAKLFQVSRLIGFKYKLQLSSLKSSHQTRNKTLLSNSKSLITNFFSNNKSMVKLIQSYKKQSDTDNKQSTITTDQLIQLLIQLIEIYFGNQLEITEEEIIQVLQDYTSLNDLIARCLSGSL